MNKGVLVLLLAAAVGVTVTGIVIAIQVKDDGAPPQAPPGLPPPVGTRAPQLVSAELAFGRRAA